MKTIQVYIVDDHSLVLAGINNVLKDAADITITGEFLNGKQLLDALAIAQPDLLLLDILLPDISGKDLALIVRKQYPNVKIIALTSLDAPVHVKAMMRNGCDGYLLKNADKAVLIDAIQKVHQGEKYIEKSIEQQMLNSFMNYKNKQKKDNPVIPKVKLTQREKEILSLLLKENNNNEIADQLFLSVRTVEFHRQNLQQKLEVKSSLGLLKAAIDMGLIDEMAGD